MKNNQTKTNNNDITVAVEAYINRTAETNYAIMIEGVWGVGKSYFFKNSITPLIKEVGLQPIYISLIGVNNDTQLEQKIFEQINPFHNERMSKVAREAEYLESLINSEKSTVNAVPKKVVLVFDDLERINRQYFESAMGLINVYIEHDNTKCIFIANEHKLLSNFPSYNEIKEKYIQFTYSFSADFEAIFDQKNGFIIENDIAIEYSQIVDIFHRGKSQNLRTLLFSLSIFEDIVEVLKINSTEIELDGHRSAILQLILNYICFYAIELKDKGVPHSIIDQITVIYGDVDFLKVAETGEDLATKTEEKETDAEILKSIQRKYFSNTPINFEYFGSIANYIVQGILNKAKLKEEIEAIKGKLDDKELTVIMDDWNNRYLLRNKDFPTKLNEILDFASKGKFPLIFYITLYKQFYYYKNEQKLQGIENITDIEEKLKKGIDKALNIGKLKYTDGLAAQIHSTLMNSGVHDAINEFKNYVIEVNEKIGRQQTQVNIDNLTEILKAENIEELYNYFDTYKDAFLTAHDAGQIYPVLKIADNPLVNAFYHILKDRYKKYRESRIISQMPKHEHDFIKTLYNLLANDKTLDQKEEKVLSQLSLIRIQEHLKSILDENKQ